MTRSDSALERLPSPVGWRMDCRGRSGGGRPVRRLLPSPARLCGGSKLFKPRPSAGRKPNPGQYPSEAPDGPSSKVMVFGQTDQTGRLNWTSIAFGGSPDRLHIRHSFVAPDI